MTDASMGDHDSSDNDVSIVEQIPQILMNHLRQRDFAVIPHIIARIAEDSRLTVQANWDEKAGDEGAGGIGSEGVAILSNLLEATNRFIHDVRKRGVTDLPLSYRLVCHYSWTDRFDVFDLEEKSGKLKISASSSFNGVQNLLFSEKTLANFNQFERMYFESLKSSGGKRALCGLAARRREDEPAFEDSGSPEPEPDFAPPVSTVTKMIRYPTPIRVCAATGFAAFVIGIGFGIALFFFSPPPGLWTVVGMSSPLIAAVGFGLIAVGGAAARDHERQIRKRHEDGASLRA